MTCNDMQNLNRKTIEFVKTIIEPGMNLQDIRKKCEKYLFENGADSFWYYNIGAFIFSGDETSKSISGRKYITSNRLIQDNDIITIDLSPQNKKQWGDYARTIIIENGRVVQNVSEIKNSEWRQGLLTEEYLHSILCSKIDEHTTFQDLYFKMNEEIINKGYINLDFLGNLGHTIEKSKIKRKYIKKGNKTKLKDVEYFTFEPHISLPNSKFGYKMENIYSYKDNKLVLI